MFHSWKMLEVNNLVFAVSQLHPDVNQDDPKTHDKFVELKDAYGTLLKEDSREQYDKDLNMAFIYHRHKTRHRSLEDEHDLQHKNFERHFNVKIDKADFIKQVEEMEKESRSAAGPKIDRSVGKYIVAFYICAAVFAFFVVYSEMTKRKFSEIPQQKRYVHPSQMAMSHEKEAFMKHYKDQQDKELGHMYMMMRSKKIKETKEDNIKQAQFAEEKVRKNRRLRTGGSKKKEETAQ
ncbi:uncharacterized protein LOC127739158 isoform X2 [Mytilus californianus]|uniref:uncharacterized protein LOC127739158 isoform X2 n=1 Tax=Mytilus californianus TaxID=6549 RepID=UPI00224729AE|nr:uncharacterized protein LOC127739158 isoform X2 [Mytilus californianus]